MVNFLVNCLPPESQLLGYRHSFDIFIARVWTRLVTTYAICLSAFYRAGPAFPGGKRVTNKVGSLSSAKQKASAYLRCSTNKV